MQRIFLLSAALVLLIAFAGCDKSPFDSTKENGSNRAPAPVEKAAPAEKAAPPVAKPKPQAPPLLPPAEDKDLDDYMKDVREAMKNTPPPAPGAPGEGAEDEPVYMYRFTDQNGVIHMVNELRQVPARYRAQAQPIEMTPPRADSKPAIPDLPTYQPSEFDDPLPGGKARNQQKAPTVAEGWRERQERREAEGEAWRDKWLAAKKEVAELEARQKELEEQPPDCVGARGLTAVYYPTCQKDYEKDVKQTNKRLEEARERVESIREQARRAGVYPGYFR